MKIGTTSYAFRYALQDPRGAPSLIELIERTRSVGLEALQVCENARPLELSAEDWRRALSCVAERGLDVGLGCMTLSLDVLERYLERATALPSSMLRIILEQPGAGKPSKTALMRFLEAAAPRAQSHGITLAIENHFDVPCSVLATLAAQYPRDVIAFCVDTANSLRNFESPEQVLETLGARAACYHVKDYKVTGTNVGFRVDGAPLGQGDFALGPFLARVQGDNPAAPLYLENWVPQTGDWDADIAADDRWLRQSLAHLQTVLGGRRE